MAEQAGPIEELIHYKKNILQDPRRDSVIRGSIAATVDFFSKRRSVFIKNFDTIKDPSVAGSPRPSVAMVYPQISRPLETSSSYQAGYDKSRDIETASIESFDEKHGAHATHDAHGHDTVTSLSFKGRLKHFTFAWYASFLLYPTALMVSQLLGRSCSFSICSSSPASRL
jgi:hypothetical protein